MALYSTIDKTYYNDLQRRIANVLGSPTTLYEGYGQTVQSSQVDTGDKVTVEEYSLLRYDIWNAYNHINNSIPSSATQVNVNQVTVSDKIRYQSPAQVVSNTVPNEKWEAFVGSIETNRRTLAVDGQRRSVNHGVSSESWISAASTYGPHWSDEVTCVINVEFTSEEAARYFFNSGSSIDIRTERTGGSSTNHNASWTSVLNAAGTVQFGGFAPGTDPVAGARGSNFWRCQSAYSGTPYFEATGSSPYALNRYRLFARTPGVANPYADGARSIEILVQLQDRHEEDGGPPRQGPSNPGDGGFGPDVVDGTISVYVSTTEATGTLQPAGQGNFDIETPTVTIGSVVEQG